MESFNEPLRKKRKSTRDDDYEKNYSHIEFTLKENLDPFSASKFYLFNKDHPEVAKCKLCLDKGVQKFISLNCSFTTSGMKSHLLSRTHRDLGKF